MCQGVTCQLAKKVSSLYHVGMIDTERIRRMARAGFTSREIGRALDCSHTQVIRILAREGPAEVGAVTIRAHEGRVIIETDSPQVVGVAIRRALERAGIAVT